MVAVGRNPDNARAVDEFGDDVVGISADACDPGTADQAIATALERFGRVDALYHVAGGSGRRRGDGPLHEVTDEGVEFTLDLNLKSLIYSNRAAVRHFLAEKKPGSILNMASVLGYSPAPRFFSTHVYSAAKSAIIGFTRSIAAHYASSDVRCNVVAPALFVTPMSARAQESPEILEYLETKQPLDGGRPGAPADLDAAVLFFLSDASKFVTGQVLAVDGGWAVSEGQYPNESSTD